MSKANKYREKSVADTIGEMIDETKAKYGTTKPGRLIKRAFKASIEDAKYKMSVERSERAKKRAETRGKHNRNERHSQREDNKTEEKKEEEKEEETESEEEADPNDNKEEPKLN